jgi:hypothetical protein
MKTISSDFIYPGDQERDISSLLQIADTEDCTWPYVRPPRQHVAPPFPSLMGHFFYKYIQTYIYVYVAIVANDV